MDILNWLYLKTAGLVKTKANDAATDLVVLGAEVPFTQRGDGYQTYSMTLADAVAAGCEENNTLRTGIYDFFPFAIGAPVLLKTCTKVIDTPAAPTFVPVNLEGWKVAGSIVLSGQATDAMYLGTVENTESFTGFPWKITGTVYAQGGPGDEVYSNLASGATVYDGNAGVLSTAAFEFTPVYFPGGFDLFLTYTELTSPIAQTQAIVSFEFEFLSDENSELTFTYY